MVWTRPIRIRMGGTPLSRLNVPLRVLMELESVIISVSAPGGSTFASISRVNPSRSGGSSGSGGSTGSMEGQDRDAGRGKGGESVTNPIPIIGGKT
jgi:hypothetical protein